MLVIWLKKGGGVGWGEIVAGGAGVPGRMSGQAWKRKLPVCSGTRLEAGVRGRAGEGERIVWPAQGLS